MAAQRGFSGEAVTASRLYATLAAAGTAILRATSTHQVFTTLTRVLTEEGDFDTACVGVPDPTEPGGIRLVAHGGDELAQVGSPCTVGPASVTFDVAARALVEERVVLETQPGRGAVCAIPLRRGDLVVAVFCTAMADADAYDELRLHLLDRLADEVAFALQSIADRQAEVKARLARSAVQAQLASRARMQAELARIGQSAFVAGSLDELFADMVDAVRRVLNLDIAVVEEWFPDGRLGLCVASGADGHWPVVRQVPSDEDSFAARLRRCDGPLVVPDVLAGGDDLHVVADPRVRAAAGVAIRHLGEIHSVLIAGSHVPRHFAPDEVDFLQSLANVATAALAHQHASLSLLEQAFHDPLTGLPNRALLFERLERHAAELRRGRLLAVLLVDLDGFKHVNDALGHDIGDQLLVAVAERLRSVVREGDTVARLGGDEFAVLCVDLATREAAAELAERIAAAMAGPFDLETVQTFVTASVGITVHEGRADSPRALLREADAAMYVAKEAGRARYEVYDEDMRRHAVHRLKTTNDLRRALDRDELELVWHPILTLHPGTGEPPTLSLEALLRWHHPERGIVLPDTFIGLAEDTGLIRPIGEWAFATAGSQLAQWRREGPLACPDQISVNLSAHQLARPCIVDTVHHTFTEAGVDPCGVELEITETALMRDPVHAIARLRELRDLGFAIAIDDFGTGYSSMTYLRDLPASSLKIDRSFVARLGHTPNDDAIVDAIVGLAHAVGLRAVAEGVETLHQLEALHDMGCDRAQGFLWTEPLAAADVPAWIARHRTLDPLLIAIS